MTGREITDSSQADRDVALRCASIAKELTRKLERLQISGGSQRWRSARQALKTVWSKDELDALAKQLDSYRQQLTLHRVGALERKIDAYSQVVIDRVTRVEALSETGQADCQALNHKLESLSHAIADIGDAVSLTHSVRVIHPVPAHSDALPAIDRSQSEMIMTMIEQLRQEMHQNFNQRSIQQIDPTALLLHKQTDGALSKGEDEDETIEDVPTLVGDRLAASIEDIYRLAHHKGTLMLFDEAQCVLEALERVLDAVEIANRDKAAKIRGQKRKRTEGVHGDSDEYDLERCQTVKRTRGLLTCVRGVSVNQNSKPLILRLDMQCTKHSRCTGALNS